MGHRILILVFVLTLAGGNSHGAAQTLSHAGSTKELTVEWEIPSDLPDTVHFFTAHLTYSDQCNGSSCSATICGQCSVCCPAGETASCKNGVVQAANGDSGNTRCVSPPSCKCVKPR